MENAYKTLAPYYDYLHPEEKIFEQKPFFKKLIKKYGVKTCLDCACGTGWHLYMLNSLGIDCRGSDISPDMLSFARKNLKGKNITTKKADFRRLDVAWNKQFDMLICMTTSLPHLLKTKDTIRAPE